MEKTVQEAINDLQGRIFNAYTAISNKGGTIPSSETNRTCANLENAAKTIPTDDIYNIVLTANDSNLGSVSGGGQCYSGDTLTLNAVAVDETKNPFCGWVEDGNFISRKPTYTLTV